MGIDVMMYAEQKVAGQWQLSGSLEENPNYDPDYPESPEYKPVEIYGGRNRDLFAMLCGLGNPGFSIEGFEPVSAARGLPADISPELGRWASFYKPGPNVFWHSWLSLGELVEFDWAGKSVHIRAFVDPDVAHLFEREKPFPYDRWPEDVPISYSLGSTSRPSVEWLSTYAERVTDFLDQVVKPLEAKFGASDEVRLVFWFWW